MEPLIDPAEVEGAVFSTRVRGYDSSEVEAFLGDLAERLRAEHDAAENAYQTVGEEMGELLQSARDRADAMIAEAEGEGERIRAAATEEIGGVRRAAETEATALTDTAREEADALRKAAEDDAAELRRKVEADAKASVDAAEERLRELKEAHEVARDRIALLRLQLIEVTEQLQNVEEGSAQRKPPLDKPARSGFEPTVDEEPPTEELESGAVPQQSGS